MQIRKKHLLGLGGLALVTAAFAYAITIPAEDPGATSVSGQVKISVNVYGEDPEVRITSIKDGEVTLDSNINIGVIYAVADQLDYQLCKNYGTADQYCASLGEYATYIPTTSPESGERAFTFDLDSDPKLGFGDYVLRVVNHSGSGTVEDTVSFKYVPIKITTVGEAENGDPIVEVEYSSKLSSFEIQAYDDQGYLLFDNPLSYEATGCKENVCTQRITLPFASYGATTGEYTVAVTGKDSSGAAIKSQKASTKVDYKAPDAPEVPKTGGLLGNLNISRADYLITGLIVFGLATIFAVRALKKRGGKR